MRPYSLALRPMILQRLCFSWVVGFVALALIQIVPVHSSAALSEADIDQRMQDISRAVLSPFCPGRMLSDCPSSSASELKLELRNRIASGESAEAIIESLYATYGDEVRATPRPSGVGIVAWIAPGVFLLVGGLSVAWWLFMMKAITHRENGPRLDAKTRAKLEEKLGDKF